MSKVLFAECPAPLLGWPPDLTTEEALSRLGYEKDVIDYASRKGRAVRRTINRGILHLVARNIVRRVREGTGQRSAPFVRDLYETSYDEQLANMLSNYEDGHRTKYYRINGQAIIRSDTQNFLRFNAQRLRDAVAALEPDSVCEIGFGSGNKLLYLANQLPHIAFSGYELTESGTALAKRLRNMDLPGTNYGNFFGFCQEGMDNVRRVDFNVGSAFDLPCRDGAFDLVYTSSALEQMQDGLPRALSEIRRITRRHVLMFEPFVDFNDRFGRLYLWSVDYFRMRVSDLTKHGLRPLGVWRTYPIKPTFAFGMVLAEVI